MERKRQEKKKDWRCSRGGQLHSDSCLRWGDIKGDIRGIACDFGLERSGGRWEFFYFEPNFKVLNVALTLQDSLFLLYNNDS